jgi:hypothetical protein
MCGVARGGIGFGLQLFTERANFWNTERQSSHAQTYCYSSSGSQADNKELLRKLQRI